MVQTLLGFSVTQMNPEEIFAQGTPPRVYAQARFDTYFPSASFPSQGRALEVVRRFVTQEPKASRFSRKKRQECQGLYLDGAFGVGKTHLLVAGYGAWSGRKFYSSFSDLTYAVGAVGFHESQQLLAEYSLIAIDEFELDDPGDTVLISNLLDNVVKLRPEIGLLVTSNTIPSRLGSGRFGADDFLREIQGLASHFEVVTIEGPDYRDRHYEARPVGSGKVQSSQWLRYDLDLLCEELSAVHPTAYRQVVQKLAGMVITVTHPIAHQDEALRFVSFVDRLYDEAVPTVVEGSGETDLFDARYRHGGFSLKYGRAESRLIELGGALRDQS